MVEHPARDEHELENKSKLALASSREAEVADTGPPDSYPAPTRLAAWACAAQHRGQRSQDTYTGKSRIQAIQAFLPFQKDY